MSKVINLRERIHQPIRDSLIRSPGIWPGGLNAQTDLFVSQGKSEGETNLSTSALLPNDSSMLILACRVGLFFRNGFIRVFAEDPVTQVTSNGDFGEQSGGDGWHYPNLAGEVGFGNALGSVQDVYRLYFQSAEALFWTVGAGEKPSLKSMPSLYFPQGGGLTAHFGNSEDLIHCNNGEPSQEAILLLARTIALTPRQQIGVRCNAFSYLPRENAGAFGVTQPTARNMLSVIDNLNAVDGITKCITFTLDGLISRDVQ